MSEPKETWTAFHGARHVATGPLAEVGAAARAALDQDDSLAIQVFEDLTGRPIDIDLRGTPEDVRARLEPPARGPGRPKLGVTAREVTLLPRHWDWLATQPGGASVTLRKLVEEARRTGGGKALRRRAQDNAYRFMSAMAGDAPGFEEAIRSLYAGEAERFGQLTESWPSDVRDHARRLAADAFISG